MKNLELNNFQKRQISNFLADVAKLLVASAVIGYFIPNDEIKVTVRDFVFGTLVALLFLSFSVMLLKDS